MKKVLRYFQDQAQEVSDQKYSGAAYLSARSKEPQQRARHYSPSQHKDQHIFHHQSRSEYPSSAAHSFPVHTSAGTAPPKSNGQRDMSATPRISEEIQHNITRHQYAQDNILQSYDVYVPEAEHKTGSHHEQQKYWIVYIHGGYFRDTSVTSTSFYPALDLLASRKHHLHSSHSVDVKPYIAGYASMNYRLAPHPDKEPQDPGTTPTYELRDARWPEHIHDVLTAIAHLQGRYGFGERYLLAGHSVGANMAVLAALSPTQSPFSHAKDIAMPKIQPPMAVLGVSGIYDFPLIHETFPGYDAITRNAIHDEADYALASPARYTAKDFKDAWTVGGKKRGLIIAHSRDDGLVDWTQPEKMKSVLEGQSGFEVKMMEIHGMHNDIFEQGTELAKAIGEAVVVMRELDV